MLDLAYILLTAAFFAVMAWAVPACERLGSGRK